ncbi:beta-microseminoprotein-like [Ambystoma mexicanum]|uniref:beta-microseminoprotein-like n=1 Tax=Ambystoma mexicanum TaxID=8296 RepID=UPI0037E94F7A
MERRSAAPKDQKYTIGVTLAVAVLASFCDACNVEVVDPEAKGCLKDGKLHEFGETFRAENCVRCTCTKDYLGCCNIAGLPGNYDEEACTAIYDEKNCQYKVVRKDNQDEECTFTSMVV